MSKYIGIFKNNWKKITFATALAGYGGYYAKTQFEIAQHMRHVCNEVAFNGSETGGNPKNVLVIMNPVANKKKAEKLFRKYCEPILHLAGYSVNVIKTDHVGHAKSIIENLDSLPDAIVVAGGDGTSSEVVTGLMRRNKTTCPIAFLPLGLRNETALKYASLEPKNQVEYVKTLTSSIIPMIQERYRNESVIKYDVLDSSSDNMQKQLKPIYGLNQFSWGLLRDIEAVKDKYWYFGNLRHYAAALLNSFSTKISWKFSTDFIYTPPCPGCRNCTTEKKPGASKFYLEKFLPTKSSETIASRNLTNENCNVQTQGHIEANQLNISCNYNKDSFVELETKCINSLSPGFDFIKHIATVVHESVEPSMVLKSRTIQLIPKEVDESNCYYSIDGEEYDVRPIKIALIPNAIKVFCMTK